MGFSLAGQYGESCGAGQDSRGTQPAVQDASSTRAGVFSLYEVNGEFPFSEVARQSN